MHIGIDYLPIPSHICHFIFTVIMIASIIELEHVCEQLGEKC